MQSIAHGVILLEQLNPEYGAERRRLRVVKYRGVKFRGGYHDYVIQPGGLEVFPRLVAAEHRQPTTRAKLPSGIPELDALLGGGIEQGTSTLIVGAAGTGKSTLAAQFAAAAARRGQQAALFIFDESPAHLAHALRPTRRRSAARTRDGHGVAPAGRPGRADARRVHARDPDRGRADGREGRRDRQPERLS